MSADPKKRARGVAHELVDRLWDRSLEPAERIEAGANLRAMAAQAIQSIDRRALQEAKDELEDRLRKLPPGGGIA